METFMIQSASHMPQRQNISKAKRAKVSGRMNATNLTAEVQQDAAENYTSLYASGLLFDPNGTMPWNGSDLFNITNSTDLDYDYQMVSNGTDIVPGEIWSFCKDWTPTQHNLYQTANFLLAAAFLIPGSFKQSVLLVRALLSLGYLLLTSWAGSEVCSPDLVLWTSLLLILNLTHTCILTWRFLPPTLTLELTELYLKVFSPLRVSKKHFKELVREAHVVILERGDIYAVEDVSPADERLSILLKGKLRVTCDDTHLHFITTHQFVDSPEWEANHEQSDDVFQVTITAEEDCVYLCWPRMRLERVLRHRPMLKTILDCIIGKDITQKLYSLNEHLSGLDIEREKSKRDEIWAKTHIRSMSMDAVDTGTTGFVRSSYYKDVQRKHSLNSSLTGSIKGLHAQCWIPVVANHFPAVSPFTAAALGIDGDGNIDATSTTTLLRVPEIPMTPQRTRSFKKTREVKFKNY
ncbi:PREDICTED: blood vessel epicardial substance-B-like [Nicrophorus vespilloides]|uniref:Blood vessel epicardial substance-B-like n=1 Tax=Nicrophorus vespilloides TaxID=110193 RepID=A0ABM1MF33_NICVS|nr:PREDICTED: blood vessel epicardial substance-B-like [Nicrophorus vespilloides]